jgi:hypothetical protein
MCGRLDVAIELQLKLQLAVWATKSVPRHDGCSCVSQRRRRRPAKHWLTFIGRRGGAPPESSRS